MNAVFLGLLKTDGFHSYQLTTSIASAVAGKTLGHGLKAVASKMVLTKTLGILADPIGWAITGTLASISLAGPAYRVTVPACFVVAALRKKLKAEQEAKQKVNKTKKMWYLVIDFCILIGPAILAVFSSKENTNQTITQASTSPQAIVQKLTPKIQAPRTTKKSNNPKAQNYPQAKKQQESGGLKSVKREVKSF